MSKPVILTVDHQPEGVLEGVLLLGTVPNRTWFQSSTCRPMNTLPPWPTTSPMDSEWRQESHLYE